MEAKLRSEFQQQMDQLRELIQTIPNNKQDLFVLVILNGMVMLIDVEVLMVNLLRLTVVILAIQIITIMNRRNHHHITYYR